MRSGEDIIKSRQEAIAEEKKFLETAKETHGVGNFINKACRAFFGICGGLLLVGGMPGVGLAFLSTAAFNHISLKNRGKIEKTKLELLKKEEEHIAKIKSEPINGTPEMTAKRKRKVQELQARKEATSSKRKWGSFGKGFSTFFQWAALTAAVCVPAVGWVSALSLATKYLTDKSRIENAKEDDTLALRLNNLNLDLELTRAKGSTPRAAATTNADAAKVREASEKVETKTYSPEDERLVDAYIASLENAPQNDTVKQYRK